MNWKGGFGTENIRDIEGERTDLAKQDPLWQYAFSQQALCGRAFAEYRNPEVLEVAGHVFSSRSMPVKAKVWTMRGCASTFTFPVMSLLTGANAVEPSISVYISNFPPSLPRE